MGYADWSQVPFIELGFVMWFGVVIWQILKAVMRRPKRENAGDE